MKKTYEQPELEKVVFSFADMMSYGTPSVMEDDLNVIRDDPNDPEINGDPFANMP